MLYGPQHLELIDLVQKFCAREINPNVQTWEHSGAFPAHKVFKKLGDLGLLGINKPQDYGGLGLDYSYQLAFCEALGASASASLNLAVGVQTDMATPALARFGSNELREEFLRPTIAGDSVACLGISEVGAGSDIAGVKTYAVKDGDDYIINGGKMWITNGTQADWIALLCNTGDGDPLLNKTLICVPMKQKGVTIARRLDKLGMNASDTAQLFFDDVRVPQRNRIGSERRGLFYQTRAFQEERLWISACGLVPMERLIQATISYTRERITFGRRILDNQIVHFRMAELETKVELLRSLIYRATEQYIRTGEATKLISMAKLTAGRLQREVIDSCLQYFGGAGYLAETEVARLYRDGRLTSIGGGSDEMMLMMICRIMGILPDARRA